MFRAYDATRERLVAVKLFKLDLPPERGHQLVAEFERLIAAELTHPAMAAPLATGISGVSAFLAQDYVAADSLDSVVREYGPAPVGNALRVATQLAGALDFAAAVYVTHGGLHPRDVLLSSDETRLTGLGVARALERIGVAAPVRRPYTAPERIAGGEWDRRADVFSLAALTHELMWGRRVSGVGNQAAESLTAIDGVDLDALRAVFARALAELPADRYGSALEFVDALRQACPDVVVAPEPEAAPKRRAAAREVEPLLPLLESEAVGSAQAAVVSEQPAADSQPASVVDAPSAVSEPAPRKRRAKTEPPRPVAASVEPPIARVVEPEPLLVEAARLVEPAPSAFTAADLDITTTPPLAQPDIVYEPVPDVRRETAPYHPPTAVPAGLITGHDPDALSALEVTRTAVWPLVLALGVGIAIGFAGGFFTGTRQTAPASASVAPGPAGKEFTEAPVAAAAPATAPQNADAKTQNSELRTQNSELKTPNAEPKNLQSETSNLKSPAAAAAAGRLLIRSRPAGARVSVDGKDRGVTPATVLDLARGAHRIKITHDGYVADERRVVISPSRPAQSMTIALVRARAESGRGARGGAPATRAARAEAAPAARFVGTLAVDSRPAGAKVFMDGKLVGTTPISLPSVAAGSHAIRLEHDGYRRWSSSVRVVASEQNRVTASLER